MTRKKVKLSSFFSPPLSLLLAGVVLMACDQVGTADPGAVSVPFNIEDVPADAPVHYVSVKFPLDWEHRTLAAREYKGFLVYDHSILGRVGEVLEADETTVRAQALPTGPTWQNSTITYSVSDLGDHAANAVLDAVVHYNAKTVVRWEMAAPGTEGMVKFSSNGATGSSGVTSSPQLDQNGNIISVSIKLSSGVSQATVRHEMLHALGFRHEQRRLDRGSYMAVTGFAQDSVISDDHPIGHYDFMSRTHYDYNDNSSRSGYFKFSLQDNDKVRTLFQKEVRRSRNLPADPPTDEITVRKYVGKGEELSYLDIYALELKYKVSNSMRPFSVTATEETDPALIAQAGMSSGQKLLRLAIKNSSGFNAESWALRIRFGEKDLPVRLAPFGVQNDGFLTPNILDKNNQRTEIITPMEGNSRISQGKTLSVYVVMDPGANGRLDGIAFCRLNSFDCLNTGS